MKQHKDRALVLSRIDYGERDRILTLLCKDAGKITVLAKGVRGQKSRLAGGIELLCESEVTFVDSSRSSIRPLTGARLQVHFSKLVTDIERMQRAFAAIKIINSNTEAEHGQPYYDPLLRLFRALDDESYDARIAEIWFYLYILQEAGMEPNLLVKGDGSQFIFDHDLQQFQAQPDGPFNQSDVKLLRVCLSQSMPPRLQQELGSEGRLLSLVQHMVASSLQ